MHHVDPPPLALPAVSVADVLGLPEIVAGDPEIVAGDEGLDRPIRWAHVVAGTAAIALLDGGELVLTTGTGWPQSSVPLAALAEELMGADPAAVVFELGPRFPAAPAPLADACARHGVPLIVLHREVRFVQLTQRIHQRVLATQNEALEARAEVHAMLTELGLNRSPVDYVIERLADTLLAPVVLEDSAGGVVAWAGRDTEPDRILAAWQPGSAAGNHTADTWDQVPVEAQGKRWGHLTALPGPPHPAGRRTVLELGAFALALGRLADADGEQWLRDSSKRMFNALLGGRFRRDAEIAAQLAASGLPVVGRTLMGATLTGIGDFGSHGGLERALLETALRRAVVPDGHVLIAPATEVQSAGRPFFGDSSPRARAAPESVVFLALLSFPGVDQRIDGAGRSPSPTRVPALATRLAAELEMLLPDTTPQEWRAHLGLGPPARGVRGLLTSLERIRATGLLTPTGQAGRVTVQESEQQALAVLVGGLSAVPEVQEFAAELLGPLLAHDAEAGPGHSGDLVQVLQAYLSHPTNRSLAAQRSRLSRSVFYQRISLIEEILSVDLSDGPTIAGLTVALLARAHPADAPSRTAESLKPR